MRWIRLKWFEFAATMSADRSFGEENLHAHFGAA
jgi:hypothetical protein